MLGTPGICLLNQFSDHSNNPLHSSTTWPGRTALGRRQGRKKEQGLPREVRVARSRPACETSGAFSPSHWAGHIADHGLPR